MAKAFHWTVDTLRPALAAYPAKVDRAIVGAIELNADRAEGYARTHARWTDRSGNARNGLFATTSYMPLKEYRILLSHSVNYGIWLEIRWQGKYAIIIPTLQRYGKATMDTIGKALARMG